MGTNLCEQVCDNVLGSYECNCHTGYYESGFHCIGKSSYKTYMYIILILMVLLDINECDIGLDDCDDPRIADCINIHGNFSCVCKSGYTGSGRNGTCQGQ